MKNIKILPEDLFANTTTSYKFFWLLSIIEHLDETNKDCYLFEDVVLRMLADVYGVTNGENVSFGGPDRLPKLSKWLHDNLHVASNNPKLFYAELQNKKSDKLVKTTASYFYENVPYRFLSPWVGTNIPRGYYSDRVRMLEADAPYYIIGKTIHLFPKWQKGLRVYSGNIKEAVVAELKSYLSQRNCCGAGLLSKVDLLVSGDFNNQISDTEENHNNNCGPMEVVNPNNKDGDTIIKGRVTSIGGSLLEQVLPLLHHNKLEAIMLLNQHFSSNKDVSMSIKDWAEFLDQLSDSMKGNSIESLPDSQSNVNVVLPQTSHRPQAVSSSHKKPAVTRLKKKAWTDIESCLIGYGTLRDIFGNIKGFPTFILTNMRIDPETVQLSVSAYSNITKRNHAITILFSGVSYLYSSLAMEQEGEIDATLLAYDKDDYMIFKFDTGIVRLNCKRAQILNIS